jgi:hypothetical protein
MADNVAITAGSGTTVAADEVVDGTLGTVKVQFVKVMSGDLDGTTKYGDTVPFPIQGKQSGLTSGTITTATSTITVTGAAGYNLATVGITGTYAGVTAVFEGSPDGTNWFALQGQQTDNGVVATGPAALTNTTRAWDVFVGAWTQFRVRATAWTSGTATILIVLQSMPTEPVPSVIVVGSGTGATPFSVAITASSAAILAANPARRGATIRADGTAPVYLGFGVTPTTTSYGAYIAPGGYYEVPFGFTGAINGISSTTGTTARGQEFT